MTDPDQDLLTTTEGVDEGSAASTAEDAATGGGPDVTGPSAQGAGPGPGEGAQPAPPVDTESGDTRAARDAAGPGQQLEAGEG